MKKKLKKSVTRVQHDNARVAAYLAARAALVSHHPPSLSARLATSKAAPLPLNYPSLSSARHHLHNSAKCRQERKGTILTSLMKMEK